MLSLRMCLLLVVLMSPLAQADDVFTVCHDDTDNFPWLAKGSQGIANKLVAMAAAKSGITIEQQPFPWKRCLYNVANGTVAGAFAASYNDERAGFAVYPTTADGRLDDSRRIKSDGYSLYRLKSSSAHWDGTQFVNLTGKIGSQLGYSSTAELKKYGVPVAEFGDLPEVSMKRLMAGEVQMLALMTYEGDEQMNDPKVAAAVEKIASPFVEKPYFVIINKTYYGAHKKQVDDFWAALGAARESAEYKKLFREHLRQVPAVPVVPAAPVTPAR